MSTLKVDAIRHNSATSDAITTVADGTCTAKLTSIGGGGLSHRNIIVNGAMIISQRGTSSTTNGYGSVDRFQCSFSATDESPTHTQHTLTSSDTGPYAEGFRKSFHVQNGNQTGGAGASDFIRLWHKIEAQDLANSGWNYTSSSSYITLSFWVKSSVAQTYYVQMRTGDGTSKMYYFAMNLSANTWTKVTHSIPGHADLTFDSDNGEGIYFAWYTFRGTNNTGTVTANQWNNYSGSTLTPDQTTTWYTTNDATYELTGVQLEVGDTATSFEHRSYGEELMRCMRYYETNNHTTYAKNTDGSITSYWSTITSNDSNTLVVSTGIVYKVGKRASPTVTLYNSSNTGTANRVNAQGTERTVTATYGGPNALTRIYVSGASSGNYVTYNWEASAEL